MTQSVQNEHTIHQSMHADEIIFEAKGRGATELASAKATDIDNLEVPGIRAVRAFFRKRPASAPTYRDFARGASGYQPATLSFHLFNFEDAVLASCAHEIEQATGATIPPAVRPIQSPLDRRRKSLAGRRGFLRRQPPQTGAYPAAQAAKSPSTGFDAAGISLEVTHRVRHPPLGGRKVSTGPTGFPKNRRPASAGARLNHSKETLQALVTAPHGSVSELRPVEKAGDSSMPIRGQLATLLLPCLDPPKALHALREYGIGVLYLPPISYRRMLQASETPFWKDTLSTSWKVDS
ncbi:unnamed protein product [Symbiodinium sp. CCMP2456]|nr:unnamed protein product [Symbiodinium sp. CCMP2456]